jgi:hypothetical protein
MVSADADLNGDGIVDVADLVFVASNFGRPDFNISADTNSDGAVNIFDVVYVASRFGTTSSAGVSYWPMDGNATDAWGNNDCTLSGGPLFEAGVSGQALKLDGVNAHTNCGNDASLEMGTSDWTIAAWVRLEPAQSTWAGFVEKGGTSPTTEGYWFNYYLTTGDLKLYISNSTNREALDSNDNLNLNDGTWHHIAIALDRNDKAYFYVDGESVGTDPTIFNGQDITNSNYDFKIGYNGYLNGSIDEIKVYRRALTQQEIINVMNQTPPVPPVCSGTCKSSPCASYPNCNITTGTCSSGYCCTGSCTTPPTCSGTCKTSQCSTYTSCSNATGTCSSGYCCTGSCTTSSGETILVQNPGNGKDIQPAFKTAVNSASAGDTIQFPEGDFIYNGQVSIPFGVNIQGMGSDKTIIREGGSPSPQTYKGSLIIISCKSGQAASFSKIHISGYGDAATYDQGVALSGCQDLRVFDNIFEGFGHFCLSITGNSRGVVYENNFLNCYVEGLGYGIHVSGDGDASFARPLEFGTENAVYIEDNNISGSRHAVTGNFGSRYVFRYNKITNTSPPHEAIDTHGFRNQTGCPSCKRGARSFEIYKNLITEDALKQVSGVGFRGGTGVVFDNTMVNIERAAVLWYEETPCTYPCFDQPRDVYFWSNTLNGKAVTLSDIKIGTPDILQYNRDFFLTERLGYTSYTYPHPLRGT